METTGPIKSLLGDVYRIFFPPACAACGRPLAEGSGFMCARCRLDIPLTGYWETKDNPLREKFAGELPIENVSAFFHYVHGSRYRDIIHNFKYGGSWRSARDLGLWYGGSLSESSLYDDIDLVVPVPLHRRKLLKRGYNQSLYIAEGIATSLGVEVSSGNLVRRLHGRSQTTVEGHKRWENVRGAFTVRRPALLEGKHILLVDDVLTTGATLTACGEAIILSVPGAKISIAALAAAGQ